MSLKEIQKEVDLWTGQYTPQYWPPHEIMARLAEETGELAREINHLYGHKKKKHDEDENSMAQELVDILFTVVCMANSHEIDLTTEWNYMVQTKLYGRDKDRYQRKKE